MKKGSHRKRDKGREKEKEKKQLRKERKREKKKRTVTGKTNNGARDTQERQREGEDARTEKLETHETQSK